ncbi:MAG: 4Fe-4S dicluster domain-containing protein [Candidatus Helarchaeota archaeon]
MDARMISKNKLNTLLKEFSKDYTVHVPQMMESFTEFKEFQEPFIGFSNYSNTRIPPKSILFPQKETLFRFKNEANEMIIEENAEGSSEQIIFGIRSCDARSFRILDTFFSSGDYRDTYYFQKRDKTTIVGLACQYPLTTCFCTVVGGDPFSKEGLDALLVELEDKFFFEPITERGKKLLRYMTEFDVPSENDMEKIEMMSSDSKEIITFNADLDGIEKKLDNLFDSEIWVDHGMKCLGCGSCSYLCPTCHCFDVQDEKENNGGVRIRFWDSCQFPLFTLHGSGHNPRITGKERSRQRIFHKFNYYLKNYNLIGCVGCGRCIQVCPVNNDLRETLATICKNE